LLLLPLTSNTTEYIKETYIEPVVAEASQAPESAPEATILALVEQISAKWGVSSTTLFNLVESESKLDPLADNGKDRGLCQINRISWPEITDEQAFDPEWCLNWTSEKLSKGQDYFWTVCSCVSLVKAMGVKLPKGDADDLFPNSEVPRKGGAVILKYWKPERHHVAYVDSVQEDGLHIIESNYERCKITSRVIPLDDKHIMGFYKPVE
jgi:hypothetical protein